MGLDSPLVTGGEGQLGKAFRALLPAATVVGRADLDITDEASIDRAFELYRPDVVVNPAAYTKVDQAETDVSAAEAVNAVGPRLLARACDSLSAKLVQVSTDYVFDGTKGAPYIEDDVTGPRSVYGRTKLAGEAAASAARRHLIVRTSGVFGEGTNFVRTIVGAAKTRDELSVVDDQIGRLTFAPDLAAGIVQLLEVGAEGLFHLTNQGPPSSWADVAEAALEIVGSGCRVRRISTEEFFQGRPGPIAPRPANSLLDCSKAAGLGVVLRPWPQALEQYLSMDPA